MDTSIALVPETVRQNEGGLAFASISPNNNQRPKRARAFRQTVNLPRTETPAAPDFLTLYNKRGEVFREPLSVSTVYFRA